MRFIVGNVHDPSFLSPSEVVTQESAPSALPLRDIKVDSLNSLRGRVSAILADLFFHLFNKEEQETLARSLASLLSPAPGSMIFGSHCVLPEERLWSPTPRPGESESKIAMYCHSPESWKELWEEIFGKGRVDVKVRFEDIEEGNELQGTFPGNRNPMYEMKWSVTRL